MNLESVRFSTVEMTVLRVVKLLYPVCNAGRYVIVTRFIITSSMYFLTVTGINESVSITALYLIDKRNTRDGKTMEKL